MTNPSHTELAAHMALVEEFMRSTHSSCTAIADMDRLEAATRRAVEASFLAALESPERVQGEAWQCDWCGHENEPACRSCSHKNAPHRVKPQPEQVAQYLTPQELGVLMTVANIVPGGKTTIYPEFKRELQGVLRKVIAAHGRNAIKHLPSDDTEGGAV